MKSSYNNFFKTNKIMSPQDYWKANLKLLAILLFIGFVFLIFVYVFAMHRLEKKINKKEEENE